MMRSVRQRKRPSPWLLGRGAKSRQMMPAQVWTTRRRPPNGWVCLSPVNVHLQRRRGHDNLELKPDPLRSGFAVLEAAPASSLTRSVGAVTPTLLVISSGPSPPP